MKIVRISLVILFVTVLNFSCSTAASSLMGAMGANPNLSGLTGLLKGAGGLDKLIGKAPFTLLAPSNDALKGVSQDVLQNLMKPENKDQLTSLLKKHILPGKLTPEQINAGGLKDAAGNALDLGGAKITESIPTKNGLIQVIDRVIK
jgi:uncharacterized surface protein with fasciclin (FAS1) repeats